MSFSCLDDPESAMRMYTDRSACSLGHVPGREAYPPDIFYTHSRLSGARMPASVNGGSDHDPADRGDGRKGGDITGYISDEHHLHHGRTDRALKEELR